MMKLDVHLQNEEGVIITETIETKTRRSGLVKVLDDVKDKYDEGFVVVDIKDHVDNEVKYVDTDSLYDDLVTEKEEEHD